MPGDFDMVLEAMQQLNAGISSLWAFALIMLIWGGKQLYSNDGSSVRERNIGIAMMVIGFVLLGFASGAHR